MFLRSGLPAVVNGRESQSGRLDLLADPERVQNETRHGFLNGLSREARSNLYEILDRIKESTDDPAERIGQMQAKLDELEKDPHQRDLTHYLRAEILHVMNTYDIRPREFKLEDVNVR